VDPTWIKVVALDGNQFTAPGGRLGYGADAYAFASNMVAFTLDGNSLNVSARVSKLGKANILSNFQKRVNCLVLLQATKQHISAGLAHVLGLHGVHSHVQCTTALHADV